MSTVSAARSSAMRARAYASRLPDSTNASIARSSAGRSRRSDRVDPLARLAAAAIAPELLREAQREGEHVLLPRRAREGGRERGGAARRGGVAEAGHLRAQLDEVLRDEERRGPRRARRAAPGRPRARRRPRARAPRASRWRCRDPARRAAPSATSSERGSARSGSAAMAAASEVAARRHSVGERRVESADRTSPSSAGSALQSRPRAAATWRQTSVSRSSRSVRHAPSIVSGAGRAPCAAPRTTAWK